MGFLIALLILASSSVHAQDQVYLSSSTSSEGYMIILGEVLDYSSAGVDSQGRRQDSPLSGSVAPAYRDAANGGPIAGRLALC